MAFIDIRCDSYVGVDPYARIFELVSSLESGEPLEIISSYQPFALYKAMENRGFEHKVRRLQENGWHIVFRRALPEDKPE